MTGPPSAPDDGGTRRATLALVPDRDVVEPGATFDVDVYAAELMDLRGFQVAVEVSGGRSGSLVLEQVHIDADRGDELFGGEQSIVATDQITGRLLGALVAGGVTSREPVYLGTFTFRSTRDALGTFSLSLRPGRETMLRDSLDRPIEVDTVASWVTVSRSSTGRR